MTASLTLDTTWTGASIDTLLARLETAAEYVSAWCDDGFRTNPPLEDVTGGRAWIAYEFGGEPLHEPTAGIGNLVVEAAKHVL